MGVFNCQGAGWSGVKKQMVSHDEQPGIITGFIRARDVDYLPQVAEDRWSGDSILYSYRGGMFISWFSFQIVPYNSKLNFNFEMLKFLFKS